MLTAREPHWFQLRDFRKHLYGDLFTCNVQSEGSVPELAGEGQDGMRLQGSHPSVRSGREEGRKIAAASSRDRRTDHDPQAAAAFRTTRMKRAAAERPRVTSTRG